MKRILFVCLGNICRSPVAHGILRDKIEQKGLSNMLVVDSAGTASWHEGEAPDQRSTANALTHGIDISDLQARQFSTTDFDQFDYIYAMDESNYEHIISLASNPGQVKQVSLFLGLTHNPPIDVPDPYYGGEQGFEHVFQLIDKACDHLLDKLEL